ncbi:TMV resistance protein N-like [Eucalyptus grandis]|uniref:TMV resistance protein N-like n=1 Tax=Eucalyptus grandis TaxID=71139 RepID=UPI00192E9C4E|nr:TMV resistance protein N-like [Eucalyptus grandis]
MVTVPKIIEESDLAIIIFPEDNIYSELCLEEVAKIMECKKQRDLKFFSLFYKVKLDTVSGLKGSYQTGLEYFQKRLCKDVRRLMRWKDTLQEEDSLSRRYLDDDELATPNLGSLPSGSGCLRLDMTETFRLSSVTEEQKQRKRGATTARTSNGDGNAKQRKRGATRTGDGDRNATVART